MKIVSKFKDYYDNAFGWYNDEPMYIREKKIIEFEDTKYLLKTKEYKQFREAIEIIENMPDYGDTDTFEYGDKKLIAFCGKAYPFYLIHNSVLGKYFKEICYSCKNIEKFLKQNEKENKKLIERLNINKIKFHYYSKGYGQINHKTWEDFTSKFNFNLSSNIFRELNSPIYLLEKFRFKFILTVNPLLKDYNFQSQVDPYTAYQELEIYLGNDLVNQVDPNINMTDELKRDAKGFDNWSFKRHKEESKKRRKK